MAKGILFSGEMVRALVEGRKTQTRRMQGLEAVNEEPLAWQMVKQVPVDGSAHGGDFLFEKQCGQTALHEYCKPRFAVGDMLYVRENYYLPAELDKVSPSEAVLMVGRDSVHYAADGGPAPAGYGKLRTSLFMPFGFARLHLKVVGVRCERLHDITQVDAEAEGVGRAENGFYKDYFDKGIGRFEFPRASFKSLFMSLRGHRVAEANPWVFVYAFEVVGA